MGSKRTSDGSVQTRSQRENIDKNPNCSSEIDTNGVLNKEGNYWVWVLGETATHGIDF